MPLNPGILAAYIPSELAGLTVARLKALCKEKKIAGYSKLGKQGLIDKLSGFESRSAGGPTRNALVSCTDSPVSAVTTSLLPPDDSSIPASSERHSVNSGQKETSLGTTPSVEPALSANMPQVKTRPKSHKTKTKSSPLAIQKPPFTEIRSTSHAQSLADKRNSRSSQGNAARVMITFPASDSVTGSSTTDSSCVTMTANLSSVDKRFPYILKRTRQTVGCMPPPSKRPRLPVSEKISSSAPSIPPSKRFKPLVVDRSRFPSSSVQLPALPTPATNCSAMCSKGAPLADLELDHFTTVPELFPITMPPTLSQRKRVHRWAVILSGLSNADRAVCAQVSRAFRYAVYLSAASVLTRDYTGRRLHDDVLGRYSQAMTNMWPYLRLREAEVATRRRLYEASFVSRFFHKLGHPNPIATRIWASPDNLKQLSIAVRFALTRAWFELSIGSPRDSRTNPDCWLHGSIVDVQEVIPTEVWSVAIEYATSSARPGRRETLYVLEATCEVIGRPATQTADCPSSTGVGGTAYPLRVDWSTYIAHRIVMTETEAGLLAHLKWACQEDYERGISTLWLRRIATEGQAGAAKRTVAERYVLASVIGNSISGQWMSTNEMAQEFAGLPARIGAQRGRKNATLNLFLPEHHHVESVQFTAAGGRDLHPALAVVQTPHREYCVLRDNGMQVGCEEDGVAEVWQKVLRCDARGVLL
uniref:CULLIN_2 domain-containing protein n=1 Tax=Ganoderma boninense TaxID=34458 RepID=A0A5K1K0S6_9APHY|nr:CULLIN_2 domain-containing protein [Ganoderma boninense]